MLTLVPVFFLEGLAGSFFRPLAASYILAILASLVVALTVTPALSLILLPRTSNRKTRDSPLTAGLKWIYRATLPPIVRHPWPIIVLVLGVFVGTGFAVPMLGEELMPKFKETDFLMHFVEKPGIGVEAMNRITIAASKELRAIEGVNNFGSHIGRAEVADEVYGPHFTELWISIDPEVDYDETIGKVQTAVDGYPGLYRDLLTYLTERIKEVLTGASGAIVVRIHGPDLEQLQSHAGRVKTVLEDIEGVTNLKIEPQVLIPQIVVTLKPDKAAQFGLTPGDVRTATTTLIRGTQVGEIFEGQKIFRVVVWGTESVRRDVDSVKRLLIDTPSGAQVPLGDIADVDIEPAPNAIKRIGASRKLDVICNVDGRDLGSVAREIETRVLDRSEVRTGIPPGLPWRIRRSESITPATIRPDDLLAAGDYSATSSRLQIDANRDADLPDATVRSCRWSRRRVHVRRSDLVGFTDRFRHSPRRRRPQRHHADGPLPAFATRRKRPLRPGTDPSRRRRTTRTHPDDRALTTGLALVPLIVTGNQPGQEIEYPMAFVILGGLVTSTLLNLLVLPPLFGLFGKPAQPLQDDE